MGINGKSNLLIIPKIIKFQSFLTTNDWKNQWKESKMTSNLDSDGHKKNAYLCEVTGIEIVGHLYVRLVKIIKKYSFPYKHEYKLNEDDKERYGAH